MYELVLLIIGGLGGFGLHKIVMVNSFKQHAINNKINIFDSIIGSWIEMRNFILANHKGKPLSQEAKSIFDETYEKSQKLIGESILVCEDQKLTTDINDLNEAIYRNDWDNLDLNEVTATMNQLKVDMSALFVRMREDIKTNNQFEWQDFKSSVSGLCSKVMKNETTNQTNSEAPNVTSDREYKDDRIEKWLKSKFSFLKDWDIRSLSRKKPKENVTFPENKLKKEEPFFPEDKPIEEVPLPESKQVKEEPFLPEDKPIEGVPLPESKQVKEEPILPRNKPKKEKILPKRSKSKKEATLPDRDLH